MYSPPLGKVAEEALPEARGQRLHLDPPGAGGEGVEAAVVAPHRRHRPVREGGQWLGVWMERWTPNGGNRMNSHLVYSSGMS